MTPLLVVSDGFVYPFVFPNVVAQRVLVALLAAVAGLLAAAQPDCYRLRPSLLMAAVLFFVMSALLSSLAGVDVHHSLWSGFERMLGTVTLFYYATFFLALWVVIRDRAEWDALLDVVLAVAAICAVVGLGQKIDPDWLFNAGRTRVISTLGHPSYLAGLSLFGVVLGTGRALEAKGARRALALGSVALGLVGITISETRGTLLGLGEARQGLLRVRALAPRHPAIIYELASLALVLGDAATATRLLEQTVMDAPRQAEGYTRLAAAWLEQGDTRRARQTLDRARDQGVDLGSVGAALRESVGSRPLRGR